MDSAGWSMLALLVAGPWLCWPALRSTPAPDAEGLLRGEWNAQLSHQIDEHLQLRPLAIPLVAGLEHALFGTGRPGLLVGEDGWLYTAEEVSLPAEGLELGPLRAALDQAHRRLDPLGVELVVAVVPDKLRVVPEHRGALELPAEIETRYDRALKLARDLGLGAPDLRQAMIEARAQGEVFLRTDTHWSPWGARAAALAIARGLPAHRQPSRERWVVQERVEMEGDLLRFLPLGPLAWMGPPADQLEVGRREGPEARSSTLLDEPELDIWLVGTSFSADPRWAFADALQIALGREVLNLARSGEGPLPPLEAALADPLLSERPPRVLIWELPERALSTDLRGELL